LYSLINKYADIVINHIGVRHVQDYDWLAEKVFLWDLSKSQEFKKRYSSFWRLAGAGLDENFKKEYFIYFEKNKSNRNLDPVEVTDFFYKIPRNNKGAQTVQFSFATKMVHMLNSEMPIYDKMVRNFYHMSDPPQGEDHRRKLMYCQEVYDFLVAEYDRIIKNKLLQESINKFHYQLQPKKFTPKKVIDSLIWGYISAAKGGAFLDGSFQYE
jgi:hypothetical protein